MKSLLLYILCPALLAMLSPLAYANDDSILLSLDSQEAFDATNYMEVRRKIQSLYEKELEEEQRFRNAEGLPIHPTAIGIASIDLNGDGRKEILSYLHSSYWCGSAGCRTCIYEDGTPLKQILCLSAYPEIKVYASNTNGYRDIGVPERDSPRILFRRFAWNGREYAPLSK